MPMMRYAYARSVRSHVQDWDRVRVASGQTRLDRNLTNQASKILSQDFNPSNWLISHATIVASVDTVDAPNARLGAATVDGKKVLRKTTDYRVKPECEKFLNNNMDGWKRSVLLKSYKTFVGAHNFCFAPGTEIMMADGSMKAIQDVVVGDSVITHKGRAQLVTHVFERDYAGDAQALYFDKFKTPVIATGNHPFRSIQVTAPPLNAYRKSGAHNQARYRGDQIVRFLRGDANVFESESLCDRARKVVSSSDVPLTSGQIQKYLGAQQANLDAVFRENPLVFESRVMLPSGHPELKGRNRTSRVWSVRKDAPPISEVSASDTWTPASDLEPNTYVLGPNCEVGSVHCPEKARLLGYYLAEGCRLNPTKHTGVVITFGSHEQNLATDAADLAASVFPGCKVVITPTLNNTLQVRICSPEVSQWMTENAGTYSHGKRVTEEVFSWDKASLTSLLSGWMAGDGSVSSNTSRLRGATTSQVLAHQMRRVAELCGIKSSVIFSRLKIGDVSGQVRMNHADGSVSVHDVIPRHHLWELVVSQGSVQAVADQSVRWSENLMGSGGRKRDDFAWWSGCRVHKVARNQTVPYHGKVYNLEVGDDHSYVINHGIAVHNCEHVQIENLSKGRILDAVARDIGDSVYVDILIATDRKHTELIRDIESGKMSTLSMGCFLPGTQVSLADGTRVAIEDVQVGDMVLTHKGRSREVLNKQIRGGKWGVQRIEAVGVPSAITATDIHPFFVFRLPDVCACGCGESLPASYSSGKRTALPKRLSRRFKEGHHLRILNPNGTYSLEERASRQARLDAIFSPRMEEVKAADLKVGDFLCFPRAQFGSGVGTTPSRARLLGYFLAEGNFQKRNGKHHTVEFNFSLHERDTYAAEVMRLLTEEFPGCNPRLYTAGESDGCAATVVVAGSDIAAWFLKHGGEYSHGKRLHPDVMAWSFENQLHLLGAWVNGDGNLQKGGSTSVTSVSYDLICQMHAIMARCGIYARMYGLVQGKSVDVAEVVNGGLVQTLCDDGSYRRPSFQLDLGQTQSQALRGRCDKVRLDPKFQTQACRVQDDVVMFPITSIEAQTYEGWVHDMEVEEDHSYVVEGVSVHNCSIDGSECTKCGHWAADESEFCECVRYFKGNTFYDERGIPHKIAELCGLPDIDPTGGVTFIEASWVKVPAFKGAVARNLITLSSDDKSKTAQRIQKLVGTTAPEVPTSGYLKAARDIRVGDEGTEEAPAAAPPPADPLKDLTDEVRKFVLDSVKKSLKEDLTKAKLSPALLPSSDAPNDTVVKQARLKKAQYLAEMRGCVRTATCDRELVQKIARLNRKFAVFVPEILYRTALKIGSSQKHASLLSFLGKCEESLGRAPSMGEARTLVRFAKLLSIRSVGVKPKKP